MSKLVELREKQVGARIKPSAKRIIDNSKYSYADAIEYFAFNVLNKNENELQRLKSLKIESRQLKARLSAYDKEIELICNELDINPDDNLLFTNELKKNVKAVIKWFNREKRTYKTIENFIELKGNKIHPYAEESGLDDEEFKERVISDYYSKNKGNKKE